MRVFLSLCKNAGSPSASGKTATICTWDDVNAYKFRTLKFEKIPQFIEHSVQ